MTHLSILAEEPGGSFRQVGTFNFIIQQKSKLFVNNKQLKNIYPTTLELIIQKLLAILIIATAITGIQYGLLFMPLAIVVGVYIFFRRRYFFLVDVLILLLGILLYCQTLPFIGPHVLPLKILLLGTTPSTVFLFLISKVLILTAGFVLVISGILSHLNIFIRLPARGLIILLLTLLIASSLAIFPLLKPIGLLTGKTDQFGLSCDPRKYAFPQASMELVKNKQKQLWIYQWSSKNNLNEKVTVSKITAVKPKQGLFSFLQIAKETTVIAPPFGQHILVTGGQKETTGITVEPGAVVNIQINSPEPLYNVALVIGDNWCQLSYGFLRFGEDIEEIQVLTEDLDNKIQFITTADPASGPPKSQTSFSSGEAIYPINTGLQKDFKYGFQVIDKNGRIVVGLNKANVCQSKGFGSEGCGQFNDINNKLEPGIYEVQLIKIEREKGAIAAKTQVIILSQ